MTRRRHSAILSPFSAAIVLAIAAAIAWTPPAEAAERVVLVESFTSTG